MKILMICMGILLTVACNHVYANTTLPTDVMGVVSTAYPHSDIIRSEACELGAGKVPSYGLLVRSKTLQAIIAYRTQDQWRLYAVPTALHSSIAEDHDFLSDFRQTKTFDYEIRCTSPKTDDKISTESNGKFVANFAKDFTPAIKHICFQASDTYNSWACSSINPSTQLPTATFVQLNAD